MSRESSGSNRGAMRRLLPFLQPYKKAVILAPLLMMSEVLMDLMQPRILESIVDIGIASKDLSVVIRSGALMTAAAFIGLAGGIGCTFFAVKASQNMGADLRESLYRKIQTFSFANIDRLKTGNLLTRLTNDVVQIQTVVLMMLRVMIRAPLMLFGSIFMAVLTSPRLSAALLFLIPLIILVVFVVIRRGHRRFTAVQDSLDDVNSVVQENLAGVRLVKTFVRGEYERGRFSKVNNTLMEKTMKAMRLMAAVMPLNMLILNMGVVAVLWIGGFGVREGLISVGQILAFVNYLQRILFSLMMLGMLLTRLSRALASADRVGEVLDEAPDIRFPDSGKSTGLPVEGRVDFVNVSFAYNGTPVLHDIDVTIKPGELAAVMGATGSGKSTLVHLLPRFYDVSEGKVLLDGRDIRDFSEEEIRRFVLIVQQETVLFSGSIGYNIRYANPGASDDEVRNAAETARIADFIDTLPDRYDSLIGQRGVGLSGGQKQRVAVARALLARPAVLILDDCTSAVDAETEAEIREALRKYSSSMTTIVIAQRLSSVFDADMIIVMDDGKISGMGTHGELLASSTIYREIYESQLGNGGTAHAGTKG